MEFLLQAIQHETTWPEFVNIFGIFFIIVAFIFWLFLKD